MTETSADERLAALVRRVQSALSHGSPAEVAAALGRPDDAADEADRRLIVVEPEEADRTDGGWRLV
jgi:hypothetical protein